MHEIKILRSSATVTELTMGNLLTKREKPQYRDKRSLKGVSEDYLGRKTARSVTPGQFIREKIRRD